MKLNRSKYTGRFISKSQAQRLRTLSTNRKIVNGRLYKFKGTVVRALEKIDGDYRLVGIHKRLHGYVKDSELKFITPKTVKQYLENV